MEKRRVLKLSPLREPRSFGDLNTSVSLFRDTDNGPKSISILFQCSMGDASSLNRAHVQFFRESARGHQKLLLS